MNRPIKFRARHTNSGNWTYFDSGHLDFSRFWEPGYVDMETLGESTGLTDKNGREIYEGDYLAHPKYGKQEVIYKYGGFGLDIKGVGGFTDGFDSFSHVSADYENCVVIGNIYENPELLSV